MKAELRASDSSVAAPAVTSHERFLKASDEVLASAQNEPDLPGAMLVRPEARGLVSPRSATYVSARTGAVDAVVSTELQTGTLITLGLLLFGFGTMLRHRLPAAHESAGSHLHKLQIQPAPQKPYVEAVVRVVNTASQRHANGL
jgi:hypothetical protein